ncbi:MAG: TRAP transporter substrate-binding protein DctP [Leptolyngbyaceae cyanobacterium]
MKRRHLITPFAITAMGGLTAIACGDRQPLLPTPETPAPASATVRWRMATSWPKSLDIIFGTAELFCRTLSTLTQGQFLITPYESGELASGLEVLDAVESGVAECGHTSSHYYLSRQPALAFAASIPFGLNAQQQNAWLFQGGGLETIQTLYAELGVINFPAGNTGTQMGGWFNQDISTPADLSGIRMRIPGLGGTIMSRMGVEVVNLPVDGIVNALIANEVDAVEWVGPHDDEKLGLDQAVSHYYYPGWWSPSETVDLLVSLEQWNQLPNRYQAAFQAAAAYANQAMLGNYNANNGKALQRMISRGTQVKAYSPEILQAAQSLAVQLNDEMAQDSRAFQQIYQSWQAFRQQVYQWHQVNETSFASFAFAGLSR